MPAYMYSMQSHASRISTVYCRYSGNFSVLSFSLAEHLCRYCLVRGRLYVQCTASLVLPEAELYTLL